jgi:uncharacterized protein YjbI with pentapeptide repeats
MADPQHLARLSAGPLEWNQWRQAYPQHPIDLSHGDLQQRTLSGINLTGADLSHANLQGACLDQATLSQANLCSINGQGASFQQANLTGAIARRGDFRSATLRDSSLIQADCREANFAEADLIATDLSHAYLSGVILDGAYAIGTRFCHANLRWASLQETNLKQADLSYAYLRWSTCTGANLCQSVLTQADLSESNFTDANLTQSNLQGSYALGTNFHGAILTAACVEHWQINADTQFDQGVCDYIFLQGGDRIPETGQFSHQAFQTLMTRPLTRITLTFSGGLNWYAFAQAIRRTDTQNPSAQLSIQTIHHTANHGMAVQLKTTLHADHAKIYDDFMVSYERALSLAPSLGSSARSGNTTKQATQMFDHILAVNKHLSHRHIQHGQRARRSPPSASSR